MVREFRFVSSKQALVAFLVVFLAAGVFLGTPIRAQTMAVTPGTLLQAENGDSWTLVPTTSLSPFPPSARYGHAMATTPAGVLLFGGTGGSGNLGDTWLFNPATNT